MKEKPDFVTDEHLEFLDHLRDTGVCNMFGAGQYVARKFGFDQHKSSEILGYWMDTFSDRHSN